MAKNNGKQIKVIIADDHTFVRKGLIHILSETTDVVVVGEAENGRQMLKLLKEQNADIALMDIEMPEISGWDVMALIKQDYPKLRVIILSVSPEEQFARPFLEAGAFGYLSKSSAPNQLVDAIRKVYGGAKYVSPKMAEKLILEMGEEKNNPSHRNLSPREFQILCLISSGKTLTEIAKFLSVSIPTVSTHRSSILRKMGMKNNAQLMYYSFKNKIVN